MTTVILSLTVAILGQPPSGVSLSQPSSNLAVLRDLEFSRTIETWVHDGRYGKRWENVLDERAVSLLRRLACSHVDCRNAASKELAAIGPAAARILIWGQFARDAEVAARCQAAWDRLFRCSHCSGTGSCPQGNAPAQSCHVCTWHYWKSTCMACSGSGDLRWYVDSDDEWRERDLFGGEVKFQ